MSNVEDGKSDEAVKPDKIDGVKAEISDLSKFITGNFKTVMEAIKSIKIVEKGPNVKAAADIPTVPQSSPQDINVAHFSVPNQPDTSTGHNVEDVEDIPVISQPSSQYIGTDHSSTPKQSDTCSVELQQEMCDAYISLSYFVVESDDDIQFNEVPKKKEILEENSRQMHTSDEQVIKDDGVSTLRSKTESQYEIPDELLPNLNLVKSTSTSASCDSPILNKEHPFTPFISYPYDPSIENKYLKWIKDGLLTIHERKKDNEDHFRKHKSDIPILLEFDVDVVSDKNWFYILSFPGQLLNDM
ncbi:hypothetical protein CQW23_01758, partial [Capsicum baccatum]